MKKILIYNSGGGSGFEASVENTRTGVLQANIVALITNNLEYPCVKKAENLHIPCELMTTFKAEAYQALQKKYQPDLTCLSGWLKPVRGLPYEKTINIHP
jgi:folate-dependent phosphoribosylglycinamide formyltransferase PurN